MFPVKPRKSVPILAGGLFLGVLSAVPPISFLNSACCILVIGGGLLASYLYMKDYPPDQPRVTYGDGALLGLLAGLLGAVVHTIPIMLGGFGSHEALERLSDTPDFPPHLINFLETMMVAFTGIIFSIFAVVGGVLGVAIFGPKGSEAPESGLPIPDMDPSQNTPIVTRKQPLNGPPSPPNPPSDPGSDGGESEP